MRATTQSKSGFSHSFFDQLRILRGIANDLPEPEVTKFKLESADRIQREMDPYARLAAAVIAHAAKEAMEDSVSVLPAWRRSAAAFYRDRDYDGYARLAGIDLATMELQRTAVMERNETEEA